MPDRLLDEIDTLAREIIEKTKQIRSETVSVDVPVIAAVIPSDPPIEGTICDAEDIQAAIDDLCESGFTNTRESGCEV